MNIHPVFVHFPIAFLTFYAILEFLRIFRFTQNKTFFYIKLFLVTVGTAGAFLARFTGELVAEEIEKSGLPETPLLSLHESFANATFILFLVLAINYILFWLNSDFKEKLDNFVNKLNLAKIWNMLFVLIRFIAQSYFTLLVALVGLILVTVTGALGGIMVYGREVDPFASFIYQLFFN